MATKIKALLKQLKMLLSGADSNITNEEKFSVKYFDDLMTKTNSLGSSQPVAPRKEYIEESKNRIFNQLLELQISQTKALNRGKENYSAVRRFVTSQAFSILLILIMGFGFVGSIQAADLSMPGDLFYQYDIAIEESRFLLAHDDLTRVKLTNTFAAERLTEAQDRLAHDDFENAGLALVGFERHMQVLTDLVLEASDDLQGEISLLITASHAKHSEILLGMLKELTPEKEKLVISALGAADHAVVALSEIPEIQALNLIITTTLKFSADNPKMIDGDLPHTPTPEDNQSSPTLENDGYLPPGIIDNPGLEDGELPPGLKDKKEPPGLEDKEKKKD